MALQEFDKFKVSTSRELLEKVNQRNVVISRYLGVPTGSPMLHGSQPGASGNSGGSPRVRGRHRSKTPQLIAPFDIASMSNTAWYRGNDIKMVRMLL